MNNFAGAVIEGAENGIFGKQPITVANAGLIEGNAGSGIDMEAASTTTTFIDNSGAIIGNSTGPGPIGIGVNVDGLAQLDNSGLIQAVTNNPNQAAVSAGGGEIDNLVGGTITSSEAAIIVDGGNTFTNMLLNTFAAVTIDNGGTIQGDNGEAILIVGDFDNMIDNAGAIIDAGNGNDIINGGAGNDTLTAGNGNDTFVFGAGFGNDTVTDFHSGDHIEFENHLFANFAAVQAASSQTGADVVITLDATDTVTLQHTTLASLHASDFLLS